MNGHLVFCFVSLLNLVTIMSTDRGRRSSSKSAAGPFKAEFHCSDGWRINADMCYYINAVEKITWHQAVDICTALNASLLSIPNEGVSNFIVGEIKGNVWLGLHDNIADDYFTWINTSEKVNYTLWAEGEPNNAAENCVSLYALYNKGSWNDIFCRKKLNFICERPTRAGRCESDWVRHKGSCYHFSQSKLAWGDAERDCRRVDAHLATIMSEDENNFIKGNMPIADHWVGLSDRTHEGIFTWLDTEVPPTYENWHSGEPNNGNNGLEDCVNMNVQQYRVGKWDTDGCGESYGYMCETSRATNETNCTVGWTGNDHSCYLIDSGWVVSWHVARRACKQHGADLIVIDTSEEQAFLNGHPKVTSVKFWIGLNDMRVRDTWSWLDQTQPVSGFTNWSPSEPMTSSERADCVFAFSTSGDLGQWANAVCSKSLGYVCEEDTDECTSSSWVPFDGHCYHFNFTPVSWADAETTCVNLTQSGNSHLVQIGQLPEQNFINDNIRGRMEVVGLWLGLNSRRQSGSFVWTTDNSQLSWSNWGTRQPSLVSDEKCAEIQMNVWKNKGRWNDVNCLDSNGFICQKPATGASSFYDFGHGDSVYKVVWNRFSQAEGDAYCRRHLGVNASLWAVGSLEELYIVGRELEDRVTGTGQQYWVHGDAMDPDVFTYWGKGRQLQGPEPGRRCLMVSKESVYTIPTYRRPDELPLATPPTALGPKYAMSARTCCEEKMLICEKTIDRANDEYDFAYNGSLYKLVTLAPETYNNAQMSCGVLLGGTLAVLETLEERANVSAELKARHLGQGLQYWVGGNPAQQLRLVAQTGNVTSAARQWLSQLAADPAPGEGCAMLSHDDFPHVHWSQGALDMVPTTCTGNRRYICERHIKRQAPSDDVSGLTSGGVPATSNPANSRQTPLMHYNCQGTCLVLAVTYPFAILATVVVTLVCASLCRRRKRTCCFGDRTWDHVRLTNIT